MKTKFKFPILKIKILILYLFFLEFNVQCKENEKKEKLNEPKISEKEIFEIKSKFSHIKVVEYGSIRSMHFVRDNGDEALESSMDTYYPENLFLLYTQTMFNSFLFKDEIEDVLLVGLGGGSMVHFINHYFPKINLDVVEIDDEIFKLCKKYFFYKENEKTKILIKDAYVYMKQPSKKYDIIMMDAFLKPSAETDSSGIAKKFKEKEFYSNLKSKLKKDGVVVFNINTNEELANDLKKLKSEFKQFYQFQKYSSGNLIVLVTDREKIFTKEEILLKAEKMDFEKLANFSYKEIYSYKLDE